MNVRAIGPAIASKARDRVAIDWRWFALFGFAAWVLIVGSHHEPWFDEAQAWLLARDSGFRTLLTQRVRYEGTPGLWHALLWLAIRAGLPFSDLFVLPAVCAIAGAALILWRSPFPAGVRLGLLGSYFYGFQFSVVARSYSTDLVLMPLAATWFATRVDKPVRYALVLGLIANGNAHGFLLACVLALELAWQIAATGRTGRSAAIGAIGVGAAMILFALFCAWPAADNEYSQLRLRGTPLLNVIDYYSNAFVDRLDVWSWNPPGKFDNFVRVVLSFGLLEPLARLIAAGRNRALSLAIFGVLTLFSALVYAREWHAGILFLAWMFVFWTQWSNPVSARVRRNAVAAMSVILALQAVETVRTGIWDIGHVFSPGRQAAAALLAFRSEHPHARIDGYGDFAFNIQPWLDGNVFADYHHGAKSMSYVRWDREEPWMAGSWQANTHLAFWHSVLADRPGLIVASPLNRFSVGGYRADLVPEACAAGYGLRAAFGGTIVWRGVPDGDETLYLFEPNDRGPCAR